MKDQNIRKAIIGWCASAITVTMLFTIIFTAQPVSAAVRFSGQERDSFIGVQVTSIQALVNQIASNPRIRARYERLYHYPYQLFVEYFRKNLKIEVLKHNQVIATDYCVRPNGQVFSIHKTLRKGARVFALRNGKPVLEWACGNPLAARLPSFAPTKSTTVADVPTLFGGNHGRHNAAQVGGNFGHDHYGHGQPLGEYTSSNTNDITPYERTSPYQGTFDNTSDYSNFSPSGGPSNFSSTVGWGAAGLGLWPYLAGGGGLIAGFDHGGGGGSNPAVIAPAPEMNLSAMWLIGTFLLAGMAEVTRRRKKAEETVKATPK